MARGALTAEEVALIVRAARELERAHLRRAEGERLATLSEQAAFEGLLRAIGEAVEHGYAAA